LSEINKCVSALIVQAAALTLPPEIESMKMAVFGKAAFTKHNQV